MQVASQAVVVIFFVFLAYELIGIVRAAAALGILGLATVAYADVRMDVDSHGNIFIHGNGRPKGGGVAPGVVPVMPSDHDIARYTRYDEWIHAAATLYQIPEQLVRAIIRCESDYDPRENIYGGVRLLRILANEFNGDLELTIAAYNAGDGSVIRFGGIPPFQQTREYVVAVTKFYRRYRSLTDVVEASVGG